MKDGGGGNDNDDSNNNGFDYKMDLRIVADKLPNQSMHGTYLLYRCYHVICRHHCNRQPTAL